MLQGSGQNVAALSLFDINTKLKSNPKKFFRISNKVRFIGHSLNYNKFKLNLNCQSEVRIFGVKTGGIILACSAYFLDRPLGADPLPRRQKGLFAL